VTVIQFPQPKREDVEAQARHAARAGHALDDCLPYPFSSQAGIHFAAIYAVELIAIEKEKNHANS
jgi:hypothetical protein